MSPVCWEEVGVRSFHGLTIIDDLVHERWQKSYADNRYKDLDWGHGVSEGFTDEGHHLVRTERQVMSSLYRTVQDS